MKKMLSVIGLSVLLLAGCSSVKEDLTTYLYETSPPLGKIENKIIEKYGSVAGDNFVDDQTMYNTLVNEVIPEYSDYIEDLEDVKIETEEVQEIHDHYIEAAKVQEEGFEILKRALENQDPAQVQEANGKLYKAKDMMKEYQQDLKELAKENDVDLKNVK